MHKYFKSAGKRVAGSYKIETRTKRTGGWTADGIGDQNKFSSVNEAVEAVHELQSSGDKTWKEADYRIVGPNGVVKEL
jgi:hypothetical protein